jgi:hypothetical protein
MNIVYITKIDNEEKRKRVSDVLDKYTSLRGTKFSTDIIKFDFSFSSGSTDILSVESVSKDPEPGHRCNCFDESIFSFPDEVIDVLISESKQKSINPFINCIGALENTGGFNWGDTKEGFNYWKNIIVKRDFSCLNKKNVYIYSTRITGTNNGDRLKRINEVIQKYTQLKTPAITLDLEAILLYTKIVGENIEVLNNLSEVDSKNVAAFVEETMNYDESIFSYPDEVIDLLISKTKSKTINPFIRSVKSGFEWDKSEEGFSYWNEIIEHRNYSKVTEKGKAVTLFITGIDTDEKKDQVCKFIDKYMNDLGFLKSEMLSNSLGFEIEVGDVRPRKCKTYKLLSLAIGNCKEKDKIVIRRNFKDTILSYPLEVVDKLVENSELKSVFPFLYSRTATQAEGGFNWMSTKEGSSYWNDIIMNKKFELLSNSKKETVIIEITEIDSQEKKEAISELMDSYASINPGSIGDTIGFELEVKKDGGKIQDIRLIHVIMDPSTIEEKIVKKFYYSVFNLKCIDLLLSRSRIKNNLLVYLYHPAPLEKEGGFSWGKSPEGFDYWNDLIKDKRFKNLNNEMEKDLEIVKVLNLDTKEKAEILKYVFFKYLHFPIANFKLDAEHGISIGIKTDRGAGHKLNSASVTQVTLINETSDNKFSSTDFDNSVFCLPDNILERLIELSSIKSLVPYILNLFANSDEGGFSWADTEERAPYWRKILVLKKFENTYKSLSTMCKINYKTKKLISKEANEEKKVDFYVRETQLNVENELLNREKERAGVEEELNDLKSSYPLNLTAILKHQEHLEELDAEIKAIKSLKKELGFEKDDKTKEGK